MKDGPDYTVGILDVLQACDACADMGMTYSVIVQCTDCVDFPKDDIVHQRLSVPGQKTRSIDLFTRYPNSSMAVL